MKHKHYGDPMRLCSGCIPEVASEARTKRILRRCVVGFTLAIAVVCAIVLWRIGMGR